MKRKTRDMDRGYNPNTVRQYEDPQYAKAAAEYERAAKAQRNKRAKGKQSSAEYTYEDYLAARQGSHTASQSSQVPPSHSAPASHRKQKNKKPKRKKGCLGRLIKTILVLALLFVVVIAAVGFSITSKLERVDTDGNDFAINSQVSEDLKDYRNIAILGSDARKGEGYDGSRTDAIIILSVNKKTNEIRMISVMRDSYLKIKNSSGNLALDKVTHAHAYGGAVNSVESLNRNLDLNITEFVVFNWKAVADTVDALGGIEIDVKSNEIQDLNHYGKETGRNVGKPYHRVTKTGVQTFDGVQATTYCRIRKNSGGDTGRARRYKQVMAGVLKKMMTSPTKIPTLANDVMPEIRTNISQAQLGTLMMRAPLMKMGKSVSWPKDYYGGIINGVWYAVPRTLQSNVRWLHRKAFDQVGYAPSSTCRQISDEISAATNVY